MDALRKWLRSASGYPLISVMLLLGLVLFAGWGANGHRIINRNVVYGLPPEMLGFVQRATMLSDSASNADYRKNRDPSESPKHFIDIDDYLEFPTRTVPHSLDSLIARYGIQRVYSDGILPWATVEMMDSISSQMQRGDWNRVWSAAADLGHYVGDAYQPLHCTVNFDGRSTGNGGIHSRYETGMIDRFQQSIFFQPSQAKFIDSPIDYVFGYIYESNRFVDSVLQADTYAKQVSGWSGSGQEPASYYTALWSAAGGFTARRMQGAVDAFANLLFTSWVRAGRPAVPKTTSISSPAGIASEFKLDDAFPNPFNPVTTIRYHLTQPRFVQLEVSDVQGARVAILVNSVQQPGAHTVRWDASASASGVYFYRMRVGPSATSLGEFVGTKKLVLMK